MNRDRLIKLCTVGVLTAIGVILASMIHVPIFPVVSFLEYDPADVPIIICTLLFGPWYGIAMTVAVSIIQGLTVSAQSGWVGIVMHIFATGSLSLVVGLFYRKHRSFSGMIIALVLGVLTMTASMALWNLLFTPYFMKMTLELLLPFYPFIVAFNLIKAIINSVVGGALFKALSEIMKKSGGRIASVWKEK